MHSYTCYIIENALFLQNFIRFKMNVLLFEYISTYVCISWVVEFCFVMIGYHHLIYFCDNSVVPCNGRNPVWEVRWALNLFIWQYKPALTDRNAAILIPLK